MSKEYTPENLIENGRFVTLFANAGEGVQEDIKNRLQRYIEECPYKDEKNFGHLCNLLTSMAVYEALQNAGCTKEEAIEQIKTAMYTKIEPKRIALSEAARQEGYIERMKTDYKQEMLDTYGAGWELDFPDCPAREFTYRVYTCIYNETFKRYHYPELGPLFCHVDDILHGNLEKIDFRYTGQLCVNQKPCDYDWRYREDVE